MATRNHDEIYLDQPALCRRYGKSAQTIRRWGKYGFPAPDFYVGDVPYRALSKLGAWEATMPTHARLAGQSPKRRDEQSVSA